jgi:hypothetical protein
VLRQAQEARQPMLPITDETQPDPALHAPTY